MVIFNRFLLAYQRANPIKTSILLVKPHEKPPLNHHFPMVFLWFSMAYG